MTLTAITRQVSPAINNCELSFYAREPINVVKAAEQHRAYEDCLATLGVRVVSLPAEPELPDSVFVEDAAVVLDELAVMTNPGAPSRRGELDTIAKALASYRPLKFIREPATLDGGDVLRIRQTVFLGRSQRTNEEGVAQLREILRPYGCRVQSVQVRGCLHLKSACSYLGDDTVLINQSLLDAQPFRRLKRIDVASEEPGAANVLLIEDRLIIAASFPQTRALLERRGFRVQAIDISELQKAEAGVTCCSLLFDDEQPGTASAAKRVDAKQLNVHNAAH